MALGVLNAGPEAVVVEELPAPQVQADETQAQVSVPEPNVMLFAGIGGLILLLFAIRRK